jgi:hypothetical protein
LGNCGDLIRRFALPVDDLGKPAAQAAMMVHLGETKIFERQLLKVFEHFPHALAAIFERQENFLDFLQ